MTQTIATLESAPPNTAERPALLARLLFKFSCAYLLLYLLPWPLDAWDQIWQAWTAPRRWLVPWLASHVFHIEVQPLPGSSPYQYGLVALFLILAILVAAIWEIVGDESADHRKLHQWMTIYVRLFLGTTLLGYGVWKVIPAQFQEPTLSRLLVPLGEMSPQALLWTFMGSSRPYTMFTGSVEVVAALLVLVPRTMTLGALLSAASMTQVFVLNMSYDVGVKLLSFHLLMMSVFLFAPDVRRLAHFFVLRRPIEFAKEPRLVTSRAWSLAIIAAQVVYVCYVGVGEFRDAWQLVEGREQRRLGNPFYGIWTVEEFHLRGELHPPLATDSSRWQVVVFDEPDSWDHQDGVMIQFMDGNRKRFFTSWDSAKHLLKLQQLDDNRTFNFALRDLLPPLPFSTELSIETSGPDTLTIEGDFDGQHVQTVLARAQSRFPIFQRGFRWTSFGPFWGR